MKYIVETLEITRNFYVIEADSEEEAKEASKTCMDNWHQQLDTTIVDCSELDQDQLKYLIKKQFWNDIYTKVDKETGTDTMYELSKSRNFKIKDPYETKCENKEN
jgi:hypothetical protein|tara:strand:- start:740 stop:1054 length:315 start_codon:yes stop_codon:yes gene_type:complete